MNEFPHVLYILRGANNFVFDLQLIKKEQELESLREFQTKLQGETNKKDIKRLLDSHSFRDEAQLEKVIKDLDKSVRKARKEDVGDEVDEPPSFPLLEVADEELDEAGIKQKRQQKLMKSNYDARARAKAEKEKEKERAAEEERKDLENRTTDLDGWVREKRATRDVLSQISPFIPYLPTNTTTHRPS